MYQLVADWIYSVTNPPRAREEGATLYLAMTARPLQEPSPRARGGEGGKGGYPSGSWHPPRAREGEDLSPRHRGGILNPPRAREGESCATYRAEGPLPARARRGLGRARRGTEAETEAPTWQTLPARARRGETCWGGRSSIPTNPPRAREEGVHVRGAVNHFAKPSPRARGGA